MYDNQTFTDILLWDGIFFVLRNKPVFFQVCLYYLPLETLVCQHHQLLIPEHHKNIKTRQKTKFTKGPHPPKKQNTQIIQIIHNPPQKMLPKKKNKENPARLRRVSTNGFFFSSAKYRRWGCW